MLKQSASRTQHPRRPGPLAWLRYAFGAGLAPEYREWVLYDTTSSTWLLRQFARTLTQLSPAIAALLIFVPGPFWIRATMVVGGTAMALLFSAAYMTETLEHRLVKAGYPVGTGEATREQRAATTRTAELAQRRARIAARRAARLQR
jgi:hypothetical protein